MYSKLFGEGLDRRLTQCRSLWPRSVRKILGLVIIGVQEVDLVEPLCGLPLAFFSFDFLVGFGVLGSLVVFVILGFVLSPLF